MEEQNQEKVTATQHVKAADAAAPETGNGKKEDKGGGKRKRRQPSRSRRNSCSNGRS
ncbi:hypothetical protein HMPREF1002_04544 [Porphyromonas sp. 31_2]|nr:hypothetical protein HMPREF1002_04544 [Porphyromonas sp. 31_2]